MSPFCIHVLLIVSLCKQWKNIAVGLRQSFVQLLRGDVHRPDELDNRGRQAQRGVQVVASARVRAATGLVHPHHWHAQHRQRGLPLRSLRVSVRGRRARALHRAATAPTAAPAPALTTSRQVAHTHNHIHIHIIIHASASSLAKRSAIIAIQLRHRRRSAASVQHVGADCTGDVHLVAAVAFAARSGDQLDVDDDDGSVD